MIGSAPRTTQKTESLTILQRVANKDQIDAKDCIDTYEKFIRALAKKFTSSTEEAEAATQEIFTDIWRYSQLTDKTQSVEEKLIAMIAFRRLIKQLQ